MINDKDVNNKIVMDALTSIADDKTENQPTTQPNQSGFKLHEIDAYMIRTNFFPIRAREQANEWAVQASKQISRQANGPVLYSLHVYSLIIRLIVQSSKHLLIAVFIWLASLRFRGVLG